MEVDILMVISFVHVNPFDLLHIGCMYILCCVFFLEINQLTFVKDAQSDGKAINVTSYEWKRQSTVDWIVYHSWFLYNYVYTSLYNTVQWSEITYII